MSKFKRIMGVILLVSSLLLPNPSPAAAAEPPPSYRLLSDLPVGSLVIDPNNGAFHCTGENWTPRAGDITQPVVWRVVAKNHLGYPDNSVTLLTEYLLGRYIYDENYGRWEPSAIREFLQDSFIPYLGGLNEAVLPTTITTRTRFDLDGIWDEANPIRNEVTEDLVFLPSWEEVADLGDDKVLEYFQGATTNEGGERRIADFAANSPNPGNMSWVTRQEVTNDPNRVNIINSLGGISAGLVEYNRGIRPMVNVRNNILVAFQPNGLGYYELILEPAAFTNDSDLDGIYFAGDTLSIEIHNFPADEDIRVTFFLGDPDLYDSFGSAEVIDGLTQDGNQWYLEGRTDGSGRFSFLGVIQDSLPFGLVSLDIVTETDSALVPIQKGGSELPSIVVGVPLTFGDLVLGSDRPDNLTDPNASFTVALPGIGSVAFAPGKPATDYITLFYQAMEEEENWIGMGYDENDNFFFLWADSARHTFLAGQAATIRFEGVAEKFGVAGLTAADFMNGLIFRIYDNDGNPVQDSSSYFDPASVTYDSATDTLTIPVNHFTRYTIAYSENLALPDTGSNIFWLNMLALLLTAAGILLLRRQRQLA